MATSWNTLTNDCKNYDGDAERLYITDTHEWQRGGMITNDVPHPLTLVMFVIRENGTWSE
jgi:hypothetical protein